LRYLINGKIETVIVSVDAKTAREYRRQGLLTRGASLAFANWRANGVAFTLGMPNENWGSRTDALGWIRLFPLQWLVRPVRPERVAA
jgi:hypothetical protein